MGTSSGDGDGDGETPDLIRVSVPVPTEPEKPWTTRWVDPPNPTKSCCRCSKDFVGYEMAAFQFLLSHCDRLDLRWRARWRIQSGVFPFWDSKCGSE